MLADEKGKQYTITVVEGVPNGLTVTDENGNTVQISLSGLCRASKTEYNLQPIIFSPGTASAAPGLCF